MSDGARVLIVTDDDDLGAPLKDLLTRAGHRPEMSGSAAVLKTLEGRPPALLVVDGDLPRASYRAVVALLEERHRAAPFPVLVLGGGTSAARPADWPEDAILAIGRPPAPGEAVLAVHALLRLAFYRPYRRLVHDLSQPVTTLHALTRLLARRPPPEPEAAQTVDRLVREAERLMERMEAFQRAKGRAPEE